MLILSAARSCRKLNTVNSPGIARPLACERTAPYPRIHSQVSFLQELPATRPHAPPIACDGHLCAEKALAGTLQASGTLGHVNFASCRRAHSQVPCMHAPSSYPRCPPCVMLMTCHCSKKRNLRASCEHRARSLLAPLLLQRACCLRTRWYHVPTFRFVASSRACLA